MPALVVFRLIQGTGGAAGVVIARAEHGVGLVELALALGVRPERINTIANFDAPAKYGVKAEGGVVITIYEELGAIPPYNADVEEEGDPVPVRTLKDRMRAADALLMATPEDTDGRPGVLTNAIDWASRPPATSPLRFKPTAIMGASPGTFGTARPARPAPELCLHRDLRPARPAGAGLPGGKPL